MRLLALLPLLAVLAACGPVSRVESPSATAEATVAVQTPRRGVSATAAAPSATTAPTARATPSAAPTAPPTATVAPSASPTTFAAPAPAVRALYPCGSGFCSAPLSGGAAQPIFRSAPPPGDMLSYAFSPDGAQLLYALPKPGAEGRATLFLLAANDAKPRGLFDVAGIESGSGGVEGYGALGFAPNGAVLFEDQAQVFVAAPNGANRRPVLDQRPYGASSTHAYYLAPDGSRVMVVGSGAPNFFEIADVASGGVLSYTLGSDRKPIAFGESAGQLVAQRFDPPLDQVEGNPATKTFTSLAYELLDLPGAASPETPLPPGALALRDDGTTARGAASNVTAGQLLLRDYEHTEGGQFVDGTLALSLVDLRAGTRTPITLPGYAVEEQRPVWLVSQ